MCEITPVLIAFHSLHFRVHTRVLLTLLIALAATALLWAEPEHRALLRAANDAQRADDLGTAIAKWESVRALRPDYPRVLVTLARAYAATGNTAAAQSVLQDLQARGLTIDVSRDPQLSHSLEDLTGQALQAGLARNALPMGEATLHRRLPGQQGIIESAVVDQRNRWFFGDVRARCIWMMDQAGTLSRFTAADEQLLGVFGLAVDEASDLLWAGVSGVAETAGIPPTAHGKAALIAFDLNTGEQRFSVALPENTDAHVLGSLQLAPDGSLFVTDSLSPVIWRAAPGARELEIWLTHPDFVSLQGLVFSADERSLFVADYANGIWSISLATRRATLLHSARDTLLFGIDDLQQHRGDLIAVQNGTNPMRVLRVKLPGDGTAHASVLLQQHPLMRDPATGTIHNGQFFLIGDSGWALFAQPNSAPSPRDVPLLALSL